MFDLNLPKDFTPLPADGEMQGFELWPLARVRDTDTFKFNVNLALIDLCCRLGQIAPAIELGAVVSGGEWRVDLIPHCPERVRVVAAFGPLVPVRWLSLTANNIASAQPVCAPSPGLRQR